MSTDHFEHVYEPTSSSWAFWIMVCILMLFGAFWYFSEQSIRSKQTPGVLPTSPTASLNSLQAAVIESVIPDFSAGF